MRKNGFDIVVMVASAGGFAAFKAVLEKLPPDFCTPIVVLQHLLPGCTSQLPYLSITLPIEYL